MDFTEGTALEIIERLSTAYGVTTQKALAECLGVPAANVSNWVKRDSVPGSAFVKCALDTGSDLHLLTIGKLANASSSSTSLSLKGKALYDEIISNGGRPVLRRIMDAYGFTLQKQLCDLLGISSGTVSTWIRRNYFPGDVVVTCALDTGVSLQWLATGEGTQLSEILKESTGTIMPCKNLIAGILQDDGTWEIDLKFIQYALKDPFFVSSKSGGWIVDKGILEISNGRWLLDIDGKYDIYDIALLPRRKISVSNNGINFTCKINDVSVSGKVVLTMECGI